jgi:outer membrane protein OmpA-like peptidoglycan-associated protein
LRNKIGGALVVFLGALGAAIPASAQATIGYSTLDISIFGGGQFPQLYQGEASRAINYDEGGVFGFKVTEDIWNKFGVEETFDLGRANLRATLQNDPLVNVYGIAGRNYNLALTGLYYFTGRGSKWRPFLEAGPGITWYRGQHTAVAAPGGPPEAMDMKYGPALVYGGGVKYNGWKKVGLRFDVTDTFTKSPHYGFPSYSIENGAVYLAHGGTEHFLTATVGITFHIREHVPAAPPPPPPPAPKAVPPAPAKIEIAVGSISGARDVCPGESLTLGSNATVSGATPSYQWLVNGSPSGATGTSFSVPTASSGTESIALRVSAGDQSATSGAVSVRVKNYARPTVHLRLAQTTIAAGGTDGVSATATGSECGDPVRIAYSASEGTIGGGVYDSSSVAFQQNAGRLQTKTIRITATATDRTGAQATDTAELTVTSKPVARRLEDLVFPANSSRVNNCAKRVLLEVLTPILRDDPNAKVILIGHRDSSEKVTTLDRARVLNAAAVLSAGTGICPLLEVSRIQGAWVGTDQSSPTKPSFCGTSTDVKEKAGQAVVDSDQKAQFRRVEIWVVPGGADMPAGVSATDLPAPAVKALGCPR